MKEGHLAKAPASPGRDCRREKDVKFWLIRGESLSMEGLWVLVPGGMNANTTGADAMNIRRLPDEA